MVSTKLRQELITGKNMNHQKDRITALGNANLERGSHLANPAWLEDRKNAEAPAAPAAAASNT